VTGEPIRVARFVGDADALVFAGRRRAHGVPIGLKNEGMICQYEDARKLSYYWQNSLLSKVIICDRHCPFSNGILV